jgi:hypothetical protein
MQIESPDMAMANLANLAKFDPENSTFSRFSQKSHSHRAGFTFQAGSDATILVEAWTPAGNRMMVEAKDQEHAEWIQRMNPPPRRSS